MDQHRAASDANDFETEHRIYHEDAVLEYPQSGERSRIDATYRTNALVSRAISGLLSYESLAAVIFGSPNSSGRYHGQPSGSPAARKLSTKRSLRRKSRFPMIVAVLTNTLSTHA